MSSQLPAVAAAASFPLAAVAMALAAATTQAASASLQHQAASQAPASTRGVVAVMLHLVRQPRWLAGSAVSGLAMALHAVALKCGAIVVVQPVMITGVILAVVARAALDRRWVRGHELAGVVLAAAGLGGFLLLARPDGGSSHADGAAAALVAAAAGLGVAVMLTWRLVARPSARVDAYLTAVASGTCFGILAGLIKVVAEQLADAGMAAVLGSWPLWAMCLAGAAGTMLNQRAYQVAPISVAMPVVNVVDIVVAVGFAWAVYEQAPSTGSLGLSGQVVCLALAAVGLRTVAAATTQGSVPAGPGGSGPRSAAPCGCPDGELLGLRPCSAGVRDHAVATSLRPASAQAA
jgi:hypothetical protein